MCRNGTAARPAAAAAALCLAALVTACEGAGPAGGPLPGADAGWPGPDAWAWTDDTPSGPPAPASGAVAKERSIWRGRVAQIRAEVAAALAPYDPPWPDPAVVGQEHLAEDGLVRTELRFTTFDGERARAVLVRPDDARDRPGLLLLHGHDASADKMTTEEDSYVHGLGLVLAREGFVTLSPDIRSFGDFRPRGLGHWGDDGYAARVREAGDVFLRLAVNDARVALAVLRETPGVDRRRIGVGGVSLGCLVSLVVVAAEPGVDAVLLSGLFVPLEEIFDPGKHHDCQDLLPLADIATSDELAAAAFPAHVQVHWGEDDKYYRRDGGADALERLTEQATALGLRDRLHPHVSGGLGHAFDPPVHAKFFRAVLIEPPPIGTR